MLRFSPAEPGEIVSIVGANAAAKTTLLLVDEPPLGLAPILVESTLRRIVRINRNEVAILLVEQNVVKALTLAHRPSSSKTAAWSCKAPAASCSGTSI